jgi:hypothetical protein
MRRLQDIEANLMKSDEQRAKIKEAHNQPAAVAKAMQLNDVAATRRRGRMMLPAPQVHQAPAPLHMLLAFHAAGTTSRVETMRACDTR